METRFVEGDSGSAVEITCMLTDGTPIDLRNAVVAFNFQVEGQVAIKKDMSVIDGPNGIAQYHFLASELVVGPMIAEVEITEAGERVTQMEPFGWFVRPQIA